MASYSIRNLTFITFLLLRKSFGFEASSPVDLESQTDKRSCSNLSYKSTGSVPPTLDVYIVTKAASEWYCAVLCFSKVDFCYSAIYFSRSKICKLSHDKIPCDSTLSRSTSSSAKPRLIYCINCNGLETNLAKLSAYQNQILNPWQQQSTTTTTLGVLSALTSVSNQPIIRFSTPTVPSSTNPFSTFKNYTTLSSPIMEIRPGLAVKGGYMITAQPIFEYSTRLLYTTPSPVTEILETVTSPKMHHSNLILKSGQSVLRTGKNSAEEETNSTVFLEFTSTVEEGPVVTPSTNQLHHPQTMSQTVASESKLNSTVDNQELKAVSTISSKTSLHSTVSSPTIGEPSKLSSVEKKYAALKKLMKSKLEKKRKEHKDGSAKTVSETRPSPGHKVGKSKHLSSEKKGPHNPQIGVQHSSKDDFSAPILKLLEKYLEPKTSHTTPGNSSPKPPKIIQSKNHTEQREPKYTTKPCQSLKNSTEIFGFLVTNTTTIASCGKTGVRRKQTNDSVKNNSLPQVKAVSNVASENRGTTIIFGGGPMQTYGPLLRQSTAVWSTNPSNATALPSRASPKGSTKYHFGKIVADISPNQVAPVSNVPYSFHFGTLKTTPQPQVDDHAQVRRKPITSHDVAPFNRYHLVNRVSKNEGNSEEEMFPVALGEVISGFAVGPPHPPPPYMAVINQSSQSPARGCLGSVFLTEKMRVDLLLRKSLCRNRSPAQSVIRYYRKLDSRFELDDCIQVKYPYCGFAEDIVLHRMPRTKVECYQHCYTQQELFRKQRRL